jgi:hypothetical protein
MDANQTNQQSKETRQWILNVQMRNTYMNFVQLLIKKPNASVADRLEFVTYLLMQERVQDAIAYFERIDLASGVSTV